MKKFEILLLTPSNLTVDAIDFKKQLDKNNKNTYNSEIISELTRTRELFRRTLEKQDNEFINNAIAYLSVLKGFIFDPQQKEEIQTKEKVVKVIEETIDNSGVATLVHSGDENNSSNVPNTQQENKNRFSKLRHSLLFMWKNGTKYKAEVNDALYEALMVLSTVANAYAQQAQSAINANKRKDAFKLLLQALGTWEYIERNSKDLDKSLIGSLPFDLYVDHYSSIMRQITKAEVQELAVYTALEKEDKYELVAKLSRSSWEGYKVAFGKAQSEKDASAFQYKLFLELKILTWEAFTNLFAGVYCNKVQEQNSDAMAFVRKAKELLPQLEKVNTQFQKHNKNQRDVAKEQYNFLVSNCNRYDDKFTNENKLLHRQKVPTEVKDLPVQSQSIGTATPFEYPTIQQLWNAEAYAAFNLAEAKVTRQQEVPIAEPYPVITSEPMQPRQATDHEEQIENKKRSRDDEDLEENRKKSTRYDSGGVSLCIIL